MSETTDAISAADRLWAELNVRGLDHEPGAAIDYAAAVARVAAARAADRAQGRAKARAPFLALADELDAEAASELTDALISEDRLYPAGLSESAERIRRAAEEGQ